MITRYAEFVIRFRWPIIILGFLVVLLIARGGKNLAFTTDYRAFFTEGNPQLQAFEHIQNTYDKSDNVIMVITSKDGEVFGKKTLDTIQWITNEAWQTPYSSRVDSITNYQHTKAIDDDLHVGDLVEDPYALSDSELQTLKKIATTEPLLEKRIINASGDVTAINITLKLPGEAVTETPEVATFVRSIAEKAQQMDSNIDIGLTGIVMMNNAFGESSEKDMVSLTPIMLLIMILMLGILLRSISAVLVTVAIIVMCIMTAMGGFGWSGILLTPPSASAPTIILTIAVADSVHILSSFLLGMRHGLKKQEAMIESIRINASPVFITSLTTTLGFLSMNFAEVPPLVHLGNIVVIGVVAAFVLSMTFLPALAVVLPYRVKQVSPDKHGMMQKLADLVINKRKPLLWSTVIISLGFIFFIPQNEVNDEFVKYFDTSVEFRQDTDYAEENLSGPYTVEFSISSGHSGEVVDPKFLQSVQTFVDHLYSYDEVAHVNSIMPILKRLNKNMHGDDQSMYTLPENKQLAAQYLLLYEMSLPFGLDINNQIDIDKSSTRLIVTTGNLSSVQILALEKSIYKWLGENLPQYQVQAGSPALIFAHIGNRNANSLLMGAIMALMIISLLLVFVLRSLKMGLISLIPNLAPAAIAFGIWGMIDGQVGMSVSIVTGMTLGIVVDDTVHFLSKYLRAKREMGYHTADAIRYTFTHVGNALMVTTFVLAAGFLILSLSTFKMNADMGLVTALTIVGALVLDFLLLPPLIMLMERRKKTENKPAAEPNALKSAME